MPFLNFGGNKNKHFNLSDMNFFMKNMKKRYSEPDPDPLWNRIRIHFGIGSGSTFSKCGSGSTITERWIRGSVIRNNVKKSVEINIALNVRILNFQ